MKNLKIYTKYYDTEVYNTAKMYYTVLTVQYYNVQKLYYTKNKILRKQRLALGLLQSNNQGKMGPKNMGRTQMSANFNICSLWNTTPLE